MDVEIEMTDEQRAVIAAQSHRVLSDANASTAAVLAAYSNLRVINGERFYTASGELGIHLSRAVQELTTKPKRPTRQFIGLPPEKES